MKGVIKMNKSFKIATLILASMMIMSSCSSGSKESADLTTSESQITDKKEVALSNEIFSIEVPSKFDGLYDTEIDEHTINIIDKESKDAGNPGWVFGIQTFENPSDYAGGPVEKVGELKLNNGKSYDVVLSYPTESQFGFNADGTNKEMPEKYKSLRDARQDIVKTVVGKAGEKISLGAGMKGEDLYKDVLNKYLTAIKEGWDASKLEEENMSTMYSLMAMGEGNALDTAGYAYRDINNDGIDELLIGEISDGEWQGIIYDIYTMVDRKPTHVVSGWDRNRYFYCDNGFIVNDYSNGAYDSGVAVYVLTNNSTELVFQFAYKNDETVDANNPWFISYSKHDDEMQWEATTEADYNEREEKYSKHIALSYKPFSTLN